MPSASKRWRTCVTFAATRAILALEHPGQGRLLDRVEVQVEAHDRGRRVGIYRQCILLHGKYGELIAVRAVALGRAGAAVAGLAEVGAGLQRAWGQQVRGGVAGAELQLGDAG